MRRALGASLLVLGLFGLVHHTSVAQTDDPLYVMVEYMKVPPGGAGEYVQMEQEVWRPIHEERMRSGLAVGWSLYDVLLAAPEAPYDFVTVNVFDDFGMLTGSYPDDVITAAHPDADLDAMMQRTEAAREIVHREVWQLMESAQPEGQTGPGGEYLVLNYMTVPPGGGGEYAATEQEVWKSLHQARIDDDLMSGWAMYQLVLPAGAAMDYSFGTVDYYDELGDITEPFTSELMQKAHPSATEADLEAMMSRTQQARIVHKSELWQVIDAVSGTTN